MGGSLGQSLFGGGSQQSSGSSTAQSSSVQDAIARQAIFGASPLGYYSANQQLGNIMQVVDQLYGQQQGLAGPFLSSSQSAANELSRLQGLPYVSNMQDVNRFQDVASGYSDIQNLYANAAGGITPITDNFKGDLLRRMEDYQGNLQQFAGNAGVDKALGAIGDFVNFLQTPESALTPQDQLEAENPNFPDNLYFTYTTAPGVAGDSLLERSTRQGGLTDRYKLQAADMYAANPDLINRTIRSSLANLTPEELTKVTQGQGIKSKNVPSGFGAYEIGLSPYYTEGATALRDVYGDQYNDLMNSYFSSGDVSGLADKDLYGGTKISTSANIARMGETLNKARSMVGLDPISDGVFEQAAASLEDQGIDPNSSEGRQAIQDAIAQAQTSGVYPGAQQDAAREAQFAELYDKYGRDISYIGDLLGDVDLSVYDKLSPDAILQEVQQTPGYQLNYQQGTQAVQQAAAARGGLYSGRTGRELERYGQDLAQQTYGTTLGQLAGTGQLASPYTSGLQSTIPGLQGSLMSTLFGAQAGNLAAATNQWYTSPWTNMSHGESQSSASSQQQSSGSQSSGGLGSLLGFALGG